MLRPRGRVKLTPFSVTIPSERAIGKDELVEMLLSEAAGILAWAVAGCREWHKAKRLVTPEAIEREVAQYKYEQDSIAQFLEERTETGNTSKSKTRSCSRPTANTADRTTNSNSRTAASAKN